MCVLYEKCRRPVWVGPRLGMQDLQGAIPRCWCAQCGSEVFLTEKSYCKRCEKEEENDEKTDKPL